MEIAVQFLRPTMIVVLLFLLLISIGSFSDDYLIRYNILDNVFYRAFIPDREHYQEAVLNTCELSAGIAGIIITVASILVQLSATRYSSRIITLFIEDYINLAVFCFYLIIPAYGLWIGFLGNILPYPSTHIIIFKTMMIVSILALLPYFSYLFFFLRPENLIKKIQSSLHPEKMPSKLSKRNIKQYQNEFVDTISELGDVILNSILSSDTHLALLGIARLKSLVLSYIKHKKSLPLIWFEIPIYEFSRLDPIRLKKLSDDKSWIEMLCLKQFETIFMRSLNDFREVGGAIAHRTKEMGIVAIAENDINTLKLVIIFFNTYTRHALNAKDVRTFFHTNYEYRQLAEHCMNEKLSIHLINIANYFKYYAQEAESRGLNFVLEVVAFDIRMLIEYAHKNYPLVVKDLLNIFLQVDHDPDGKDQEKAHRGVRKSQAILASFFLAHNERIIAKIIFDDMINEERERLFSIEQELIQNDVEEFWEIQDRSGNFYYTPQMYRPYLREFFSWF